MTKLIVASSTFANAPKMDLSFGSCNAKSLRQSLETCPREVAKCSVDLLEVQVIGWDGGCTE
jgi:hypothetical protein